MKLFLKIIINCFTTETINVKQNIMFQKGMFQKERILG